MGNNKRSFIMEDITLKIWMGARNIQKKSQDLFDI